MKKFLIGFVVLIIVLAIVASCPNFGEEEPEMFCGFHRPVYERLLIELDSAEIYNDTIIYGYWFKPHEACAVHCFFHKNGTFEYDYYVNQSDTNVVKVRKEGRFEMHGDTVRMISVEDDEIVLFHRTNGTNYYLADEEDFMRLVKGTPE